MANLKAIDTHYPVTAFNSVVGMNLSSPFQRFMKKRFSHQNPEQEDITCVTDVYKIWAKNTPDKRYL